MPYYVYILTNKSNTLYTGVTNNLERRLWELIYYDEFSRIEDAITAEKKIKGWARRKKMDLIKTINPEFKDLSL